MVSVRPAVRNGIRIQTALVMLALTNLDFLSDGHGHSHVSPRGIPLSFAFSWNHLICNTPEGCRWKGVKAGQCAQLVEAAAQGTAVGGCSGWWLQQQ